MPVDAHPKFLADKMLERRIIGAWNFESRDAVLGNELGHPALDLIFRKVPPRIDLHSELQGVSGVYAAIVKKTPALDEHELGLDATASEARGAGCFWFDRAYSGHSVSLIFLTERWLGDDDAPR